MGLRTFVKSKMGLSAMPGRGQGRGGLYDDVTQTIGNTPVVKISDKTAPAGVTVYAKCEFFNPLSSVKDRLALAIIEDAEKKGASPRAARARRARARGRARFRAHTPSRRRRPN